MGGVPRVSLIHESSLRVQSGAAGTYGERLDGGGKRGTQSPDKKGINPGVRGTYDLKFRDCPRIIRKIEGISKIPDLWTWGSKLGVDTILQETPKKFDQRGRGLSEKKKEEMLQERRHISLMTRRLRMWSKSSVRDESHKHSWDFLTNTRA